MEGDSLRSAIDIYALQITVALADSLACGIVGITAGLAVVRQYHQAVVLIPVHSALGIEAVILHQYRIAVGIIGVMVVADLRRDSRMAVVTRYVQNQLTIMIFYTIYIHLYTFIYGYRMKFPIIV